MSSERARRVIVPLFAVAAFVVGADQVTKAIAVARLRPGETVPVVDGVLHWTLQRNPGAAFGLFQRFPVAFTVLASVIIAVIMANTDKIPDRFHALALGSVLGGAAGNLVDRVVREPGIFRGQVIDFIDLRVWPVFNVADAAVVVGAMLLIVGSIRVERRRKREATDGTPDA